ncbi:CLUMA_CG007740, isoform A [Clunio marinus]|uniref:CLUMA_CG007740, isoform A n=1 Tax=Clunio marinus TaxID=568069 RepID=A0A1J1I729_9DIPT|nr:CLUMA_CG007740, isoform A [Clunio marinus]
MKSILLKFCLILFLKFAKGKIYWSTVSFTSNQEYVSDFSVKIFNDTDGATKLNASGTQLKDLEKSAVTLAAKQTRDVFKINADSCKLNEDTFKNFLAHAIYADMKEKTNFRFSCPQRKGFFKLEGFVLPSTIPYLDKAFRNIVNGYFEFTFTIRGKPYGQKKLLMLIFVKLYGVVR